MKFAQFTPISRKLGEFRTLGTKINTYVIDFQISDHRQRKTKSPKYVYVLQGPPGPKGEEGQPGRAGKDGRDG